MRPYSNDLRQKVVDAYPKGEGSMRSVAARFSVSLDFVWRLLKRYQQTRWVDPKAHGGGCVFQRIRPPIPAESGRLVQRKPATYSSGIWPPIPAESGRLIHRKPATQSKGKRPPVMAVRSGSFYSYCVSV